VSAPRQPDFVRGTTAHSVARQSSLPSTNPVGLALATACLIATYGMYTT
jgi:hypothetical protein